MGGGSDLSSSIQADRSARTSRFVGSLVSCLTRTLAHPGPVVAVGIALWLTAPTWSGGPPTGDDVTPHLIRAQYGLDHFAQHGRIDGWQPTFGLGYQQFLLIGPLFTWTVGLARLLTFGGLSVLGAFKLVVVASFAALPLAVVFLARSFGLDRRAAGVAAVLSLTLSSPFGGVGLGGVFTSGLVVHQVGSVLFCISLGSAVRLLVEPKPRWIVATGVAVGLLAVTHGVSMILFALLLPVIAVLVLLQGVVSNLLAPLGPRAPEGRNSPRNAARHSRPRGGRPRPSAPRPGPVTQRLSEPFTETELSVDRARLFHTVGALGTAFALAFLLAAFALLPLFAHRDLRGPLTTYPHVPLLDRLGEIWSGGILFRPTGVASLIVVGWLFGLSRMRRNRPLMLALLAAPMVFLLLGEAFTAVSPTNTVSLQIPNRGLGYAGLIAVLPLAALLTLVGQELFGRLSGRRTGRFSGAVAVTIAALVVVLPSGSYRDLARPVEPKPVMHEAAARLRALVPDGARYVMQRGFIPIQDIAPTGIRHADFWMAWASGRNTLNVFNIESSSSPVPAREPERMLALPPERAADRLARYGVTHVLLIDTRPAEAMLRSPRFLPVWSSASLAIVAVQARPGQPSPASLLATEAHATARLVGTDPEHLRIAVHAEQATEATVAVAWSPKWHARIDGRPVPLRHTPEGLLAVELPGGTSTLALDFRSDTWDRLGTAVSLATIAGLVLWSLRRRLAARNRPVDKRS